MNSIFCYILLIDFSGPFLALVLERENAIKGWRELIGPTQPDR